MIVDVELGSRTHAVDVRRDGDRWLVAVDGREIAASVTDAAGGWSLLIGHRSYDIAFEPQPGGALVVHVGGRAVRVAVSTGFTTRRRDGAGAGPSGPAIVAAPMPGRIVRVLVDTGDVVDARQGLVVVEAMKMENELRAPRPGRIADIRVREGASVEAGAVLVVIE